MFFKIRAGFAELGGAHAAARAILRGGARGHDVPGRCHHGPADRGCHPCLQHVRATNPSGNSAIPLQLPLNDSWGPDLLHSGCMVSWELACNMYTALGRRCLWCRNRMAKVWGLAELRDPAHHDCPSYCSTNILGKECLWLRQSDEGLYTVASIVPCQG